MYLEPNYIFDDRYRLIELLGQGASAQVWLAEDTLTNNLRVAIKIFSGHGTEMDSYGKQDFQKEFTTVYNINHQNLLTPTNYSIYRGVPYLVLPYCENGSVSSMIGRCEETDIIKLLHDVSAGLDYLHRHGVIHQDIKPDNIMLDDELNYMVTDFGISTGTTGTDEAYGGTRAYMAPERFAGVSDDKGDVWALGATAYEMITGNAPFGDHGGLVQSQGEPVEPITNNQLSPELTRLVESMLDSDPAKRPTTDQIRRLTERRLDTGSWKATDSSKRTLKIGGIVIGLIAVVAIFFVWGMLRTKTYYYSDYVEVNGAPVGIGSLYGSEQRAREYSYRIQTRGGKVRRLSLVNGHGKIVDYVDAEHVGIRFADQEYHYNTKGEVDYMIARNAAGKVLLKVKYDDKHNTADLTYDDENNSPKFFRGDNEDPLAPLNFDSDLKSDNIAAMRLKYDDEGRLISIQYLSLLKKATPNAEGSYGEKYKYDDAGRIVEVTSVDMEGNPVSNSNGMATIRYKYDENGNRTSVAFFDAEGNPAQDGNNIYSARLEYSPEGNLIKETYYNADDDPVASTKSNVFGYKHTFDENGFRTSTTAIDGDGQPTYTVNGYVTEQYTDDGNGFRAKVVLLDLDGDRVIGKYENNFVGGHVVEYNEYGQPLKVKLIGTDDEVIELPSGIATVTYTYSDSGDLLSMQAADAEGGTAALSSKAAIIRYEYDDLGRVVCSKFFDADNNPAVNDEGTHEQRINYTDKGAISSMEFLGTNGNPYDVNVGFSKIEYTYDDQGRIISLAFTNAAGNAVMFGDYARRDMVYDRESARLSETRDYGTDGRLLRTNHIQQSVSNGRPEATWITGPNDQLIAGEGKLHYKYNRNGQLESIRATDLGDHPVNASNINPDKTYYSLTASTIKYKYNSAGLRTEESYWKADGTPATASDGTHLRAIQYDDFGHPIKYNSYNANGSPIAINALTIPEVHNKYDQRHNVVERAFFDGNGRPINSTNGHHKENFVYDSHGNQISFEIRDTKDNLINSPVMGNAARTEREFNNRNQLLKEDYFNADGKLVCTLKYTYNDRGANTRVDVLNAANKLDDSLYGFSRIEITLASDDYTPVTRKYYNSSIQSPLVVQYWDKNKGTWSNSPVSGQAPVATEPATATASAPAPSGNTAWMARVQRENSTCPKQVEDGLVLRSIKATPTSVTITVCMKYVGNNYDRDEVRELGLGYLDYLEYQLDVPTSVTRKVVVLNRDNQQIYTSSRSPR